MYLRVIKKQTKSFRLFLTTGIALIIFSLADLILLRYQVTNVNHGNADFSYGSWNLLLITGFLFLSLSLLYLLTKRNRIFRLSEELALAHYFLSLFFILYLLLVTVLETFPAERPGLSGFLSSYGIFSMLSLILGQVLFIYNLIRTTVILILNLIRK